LHQRIACGVDVKVGTR